MKITQVKRWLRIIALVANVMPSRAEDKKSSAFLTHVAGPFEPTTESLSRYNTPDWFTDAKFGSWHIEGRKRYCAHNTSNKNTKASSLKSGGEKPVNLKIQSENKKPRIARFLAGYFKYFST